MEQDEIKRENVTFCLVMGRRETSSHASLFRVLLIPCALGPRTYWTTGSVTIYGERERVSVFTNNKTLPTGGAIWATLVAKTFEGPVNSCLVDALVHYVERHYRRLTSN